MASASGIVEKSTFSSADATLFLVAGSAAASFEPVRSRIVCVSKTRPKTK